MSATVAIVLSPRAQKLLAAAPAWPVNLLKAMRTALNYELGLAVGHIVRNKLSTRSPQIGPKRTLGVVTNRLRLSVWQASAKINGNSVAASIGSNVKYAGVHEFGFSGTVNVKAFTRRQVSNDIVGGKRRGFTARNRRERISARGLSASGFARVKAHKRKVDFPARAMFRTGLQERAPNLSRALSAAIVDVFTANDKPEGGTTT